MAIKVLIIDDSALIRQVLTELLSRDPDIEVVGTAPDPIIARERIKALSPDVLTLDIEMPRMDGLSFLKKLMALRPMPVLVVSTLTQKGADAAVQAMELGAVDYVPKPLMNIRSGMVELGAELVAKVKMAAACRPRARQAEPGAPTPLAADPRLSTAGRVVAIGASTGGVEALQRVISRLPATSPAILVTQHMPAGFTTSFARRLNEQCALTVSEAADGRQVLPGHVYIAPGARHLELVRTGAHYACRLHDGPPVSGHRPSVDVLFASVAASAGKNAMGLILTGMGRDGAAGLLEMRRSGARCLGQSEASCVVYGMPKAAMQAGAVEAEMTLDRLAEEIVALRTPAHA
ncbi:protein-glutamate methylesterase/protein-glutamine glutaminase [Muricoccus pecuniae]|uniref:Protein-glutamate methylesterase/protein-glutamine glutaminase n=1 Tax=Muricoccus pecuniae TaxID=693023 RepID=A0A840Y645_9PROT|nr:chemotaxis response regulator protein-glutamate methylesterase [Roseomonas pecuniae]MBB5695626.1 two-component system chemotaxis response regulator CheB [Roseomonas pecuniae]